MNTRTLLVRAMAFSCGLLCFMVNPMILTRYNPVARAASESFQVHVRLSSTHTSTAHPLTHQQASQTSLMQGVEAREGSLQHRDDELTLTPLLSGVEGRPIQVRLSAP